MLMEVLDVDRLTAKRVLLAILRAIVTGLSRGEIVYIRGFGTFKVVQRHHRPTPNNILTNGPNGPLAYSPELLYYPPRRVVIFEPSLPLMAMLNMGSPNYKERRTQRRWGSRASACE